VSGGVDLHTHSTCSDGVLRPQALVALLAASGIRLFSLTDHDTVDGLEAAGAAARAAGIIAIPGIELSATWQGRGVHVVGLGIDPDAKALRAALGDLGARRALRAEAIAQRLERAGAPGRAMRAATREHAVPTRTHMARALVALGAARDVGEAFRRFLAKGAPGYVATEWPTLEATVAVVNGAGGRAVLAHPLRYTLSAGQRRQLAAAFKAAGGAALEVVTGGAPSHQVETATGLCLRAGLEGSVGSDCHDPALPWQRPDRLAKLPAAVAPVWGRWDPTTRRAAEA
jgi:hypothetical protein